MRSFQRKIAKDRRGRRCLQNHHDNCFHDNCFQRGNYSQTERHNAIENLSCHLGLR